MILAAIAVSVYVRLKRPNQTYAESKHTFNF
jgi:hypothetical protein